jgi:hypothetical protein
VTGAVLATTVPLCLSQVPYAALPQLASTGATSAQLGDSSAVLRAASLALPFAVAFAPLAALAIRRFRAFPVLLAGLIATVAGDMLTGPGGVSAAPATVTSAHAAAGGALHGIAAGLTIVATAALVTERAGLTRRLLAAWWAAVVVASLALLPALTLSQHPAGGWPAAFGPVPWLTISAIAAMAAYPLLVVRPWPVRTRTTTHSVPLSAAPPPGLHLADNQHANGAADPATALRPAGVRVIISGPVDPPRPVRPRRTSAPRSLEHVRIALLVLPAAALGVVAVAATYRPADTIVVAAACGVAALVIMAAMAVRGAARGGFGVACAIAGFALAPTSATLAGLRAAGTAHGADGTLLAVAAVAGAIAGAGAGYATSRPADSGRVTHIVSPVPAAGLLLAAAALVAGSIAGPFTNPALLGVLAAAVTGGLSLALARSGSRIAAAGAMTGVVVLASAALAGYLTAGALEMKLAAVTALGWWELLAAAAAVAVAVAACARRARDDRDDRGRRPVRPVNG